MSKETERENAQSYWRSNLRLIRIVLIIWVLVSLGASVLLKPLLGFTIPGFQIPTYFWFAHQGAMIIFVILIFAYARAMDGVDSDHGVSE